MAFSAADRGLPVDTDGVVDAQSGAAPTAEGKTDTFNFVF